VKPRHSRALIFFLLVLLLVGPGSLTAETKRVVIVKLDGVPHDLLERELRHIDPATGKSNLPWIDHIFAQRGARVENFYVRAISLSAPSWSLLDTGQHLQIHGNAEFDRYTYHVYDYLNFFPFYLGYALSRRVDMPGVEVLDELGIPLLIDYFPYQCTYQSFQLYQRGVRWKTLQQGLKHHFSRSPRDLLDEWTMGFQIGSSVEEQTERELIEKLADPNIRYLDYFTGEYDHVGHLTPDPATQRLALQRIDALIGRIFTAIQSSSEAARTTLVVVSDHGMNTEPEVYSQGYDLVEFLTSRAGGAHHVVTDRHPLTEFKLKGLDPFVSEVITPSEESLYLKGDANQYPTALLDLDGNERASVYLRNSDFNALHILLGTLSRSGLQPAARAGLIETIFQIIERNRSAWRKTLRGLREELAALHIRIEQERIQVEHQPKNWTPAQRDLGLDKAARRLSVQMSFQRDQERGYLEYTSALDKLLALSPADFDKRSPAPDELIPKRTMGDANTIHDLQNYVIGPAPGGGFLTLNYFAVLAGLSVRNNVQPRVGARPVDFIAMRLPDQGAIWLYGDESHQAIIQSRQENGELHLRYLPVRGLRQDADGSIHFQPTQPDAGFPLRLWEDPDLAVPTEERAAWLSAWHTELEWLHAVHKTRYSDGILALHEQFLRGPEPRELVARFNARRRRLAEPDFIIFANDHWNFNVRGFNPGGNHGSLLRISTHSVLMLAGGDETAIPRRMVITEPYDSLSFVPTILNLMGLHHELPGRPIHELTTSEPRPQGSATTNMAGATAPAANPTYPAQSSVPSR
jgi:predicted AlkP superfamily pyrophosphatase or phosphodiesterase